MRRKDGRPPRERWVQCGYCGHWSIMQRKAPDGFNGTTCGNWSCMMVINNAVAVSELRERDEF